jgi:holliday junction DNA helicase RuvA
MIFFIKGTLRSKNGLLILLEVAGIGYGIYASSNTLAKLTDIGKEFLLYTHLIIREDSHTLYGFFEEREKLLFCELIKISGFGPKLALSVLSHLTVDQLLHVIMLKEVAQLTNLPGIGNKTAQRLIIEMENAINNKKFADLLASHAYNQQTKNQQIINDHCIDNRLMIDDNMLKDTQEALVSLGYKNKEAALAIQSVMNNKSQFITCGSSSELLKAALKNLSKSYLD